MDQELGRVGAEARLPMHAQGGTLEELCYIGTSAKLTFVESNRLASKTAYEGYVRGSATTPFARHGSGRMVGSPFHGPRSSQDVQRKVLTGLWSDDKWQWLPSSSPSPTFKWKETLHGAVQEFTFKSPIDECPDCLSVHKRGYEHRCDQNKCLHTGPHRRARPSGDDDASTRTTGDDDAGTPSQKGSSATDFIVGTSSSKVYGFIRQAISNEDLHPTGGCKGAYALVCWDRNSLVTSLCSAPRCKQADECRTKDVCPHMQRLQAAVKRNTDVSNTIHIPSDGQLSLDGFIGLVVADPSAMPPRCCDRPCCVSKRANLSPAEGGGGEGGDGGEGDEGEVGDGVEGEGADDGTEDDPLVYVGEDDTDGASTVATEEAQGEDVVDDELNEMKHAYGYRPKVTEILRMRVIRLRLLCATHNLPTNFKKERLQVSLTRHFHGAGGVEDLPQHIVSKSKGAEQKLRTRKAGSRHGRSGNTAKIGGLVGSAPDPGIADRLRAFNESIRARWCKRGSMCAEHARQLELGTDFAKKLREFASQDAEAAATLDVELQEDLQQDAPAASSDDPLNDVESSRLRQLPLGTRMLFTPLDVDKILYSILISRGRNAAPVIRLTNKLYAVQRHESGDGSESSSSPGGYSLVTVNVHAAGGGATGAVLQLGCTCSEFRRCKAKMGGKSKYFSARTCICCKMVVAAGVLCSSLADICAGKSAWQLAIQQLEGGEELLKAVGDDDEAPEEVDAASGTDSSERDRELEEILAESLRERLPQNLDDQLRRRLKMATCAIECAAFSDVGLQSFGSAFGSAFPSTLSALPVDEPVCARGCIKANQEPLPLHLLSRPGSTSGGPRSAWVFIGQVIRRQLVLQYSCPGCKERKERHVHRPQGRNWTLETGLFNVCDSWFFSVLLLEKVTARLRDEYTPAWTACRSVLAESYEFMRDAANDGSGRVPPLPKSFEMVRNASFPPIHTPITHANTHTYPPNQPPNHPTTSTHTYIMHYAHNTRTHARTRRRRKGRCSTLGRRTSWERSRLTISTLIAIAPSAATSR